MNYECQISRALPEDIDRYVSHTLRQIREVDAKEGYNHPFSPDHIWDEDSFTEKILTKWSLSEHSLGWQIAWKLEHENKIVGHLCLTMPNLSSADHRINLSMGIEAPYRGAGYGRALLATGVLWAKAQARLLWIDLEVFETNMRAIQLYKRFGFEEHGVCIDAYRIKGESITNILMALKLT